VKREEQIMLHVVDPPIITEGLPEGYRIIADEQDQRFYPQRTADARGGGFRFATREDLGGGYIDVPLGFSHLEQARALITRDAACPREASCGSIVYSHAELSALLA
jgi:hypothetical protein